MSPAAVPALPMPKAETKDAGAFIASDWHALKGTDQTDLSFVRDPLDPAGDIVLQMEYPKGSYSGSDSGGVGGLQFAVYGERQNRAILSYEVRTYRLSLVAICRSSMLGRSASIKVSTLSKAESCQACTAAIRMRIVPAGKTANRASPSVVRIRFSD